MAETPRERWAGIERLLDQTLDLPPADRAAFLERACTGDLELRGEVERLVGAAETLGSFLEEPAPTYAAPLLARLAEGSAPAPGARLGSYEILRELGRGGMATVYLARDLKLDRQVALKVLRPEVAAVLGAERFLQEIRISAKLDHPHILTLIDSGESDGFVWYVLPYVRGESLRDKLTREQQLSIEETVQIATQVASALDYAHRQGVIHRDIKPENILLHEGEAVVADFGIALAVRQAGGQRLTERGVSLGTPQYMSPEQATGDRELDARSDVYSFAAVVYEMLVGEPPHTGATAQVVIAKLLTERPTRIRTVRDTVPEGIDTAVAKALAKVPADRFGDVAEFAGALAAPRVASIAGWPRRRAALVGGIIGALVLGVSIWLAVGSPDRPGGPAFVVRDRTQLTSTGNATMPAISGDGKQLAYVVKRCVAGACSYGIQVQDIDGGGTRDVVDGATALYSIGWSPDRRFLIFVGTIGTRYGSYIVSTVGGPPRFLGVPGGGYFPGAFFPGGDSLLLARLTWVWVAMLDGDHRDSILIEQRPGGFLAGAWPLNGGRWVLVRVVGAAERGSEWRILDRQGRQRDVFRTSREQGPWQRRFARVTTDGLWIQMQTAIVHLPINVQSGTFAGRADTVLVGLKESFDVAADGRAIAFSDGTYQQDLWALELDDALRGRFPAKPRLSSTSFVTGVVSPDGRRLLVERSMAGPTGERDVFVVAPFAGGAEVAHAPSGTPRRHLFGWMPGGASFWYAERAGIAVRFITVDTRTGARLSAFAISDSTVSDVDPLTVGGWAWISSSQQPLRIQRSGDHEPRYLPKPEGAARVMGIAAAPDGRAVATHAWNETGDSIPVHVISLPDGRATRWATFFGEGTAGVTWLADRSIMIGVEETKGTATLYRLRGPGRIERVGTILRPVARVSVSSDGRRALVRTEDFRGDIWLARIARGGH